ncbi:3-isopropylmalate dehydratase [Candidatus Borrarchaeum sp.]|uniref:LeuD/DmdB family oxidoreductase small subunit n=1 Tax=Candidatus Borrarchaeum sp. TaxID=2846742 RepID=UPI00257EC843|nr:3-isopropylmalate dehydratase [Candidatus Borrarchaeum sp.]
MKEIRGKIMKFGDNIDTDLIIAAHRLTLGSDYEKLVKYTFENFDTQFLEKVKDGQTIIVAGRNFGSGSSREQAPYVLKYSGIKAVLAESFARIFFRNAINIGLPVFIAPGISSFGMDLDELVITPSTGEVKNLTNGDRINMKPLPEFLVEILDNGGIVEYLKKSALV